MKIKSLLNQHETNFKNESLCKHWIMPWLFYFVVIPLSLFLFVALVMAGIWAVTFLLELF